MRLKRQPGRVDWRCIALAFALAAVTHDASASVKSEIAFHRGVAAYGKGNLEDAQAAFETVVGPRG
ncbi:MAG: hypothetical protein IH885_09050 [Myxococcales bacterium]|nr:hypothetical protein [Myxococcales bacterium]